ncbi:ATP-binding protein [Streptomyces sp. NPDC051320]|uniref:ATP-binding protein n=1 Tax=Streptomyces sp. NPDC051320 TaxID=3154644 RepID=UPI0034399B2F
MQVLVWRGGSAAMNGYEVTEPQLRCVLPFEAEPAEMSVLRKAVRSQLGHWGMLTVADEAELAATELATNVIKHVGHGVAATLVLESRRERLRIELHDKSYASPSVVAAGWDEECGRGLHLLSGMAEDWGTLLTATGKAVWCELRLKPLRHCARLQRAAVVLEGYRRAGGGTQTLTPSYAVLEESVTDIIADLLHWLAAQGGDPDDILDRAQMHFEAESEAA